MTKVVKVTEKKRKFLHRKLELPSNFQEQRQHLIDCYSQKETEQDQHLTLKASFDSQKSWDQKSHQKPNPVHLKN